MTNYAFVIDSNKKPCDPVPPGEARLLLNEGKAAVFRRYPFTLILKEASTEEVEPIQLKIDPGSKVTGIALVQGSTVIWAAELMHRGWQIRSRLQERAAWRRSRRSRKTRYRKPGMGKSVDNRPDDWLPPSLNHRVLTTMTWVRRLIKIAPIQSIAMELVRFDTQKMENPEISGVEYQQGELHGYEVREYLLEKWGRKCAYCDKENVPLEVEHIHPKDLGGSDRVSNLTIACHKCNQKKSNKLIQEFLKKKPELLKRILGQAKAPLKDAAAVNSTRWALFEALKETGLPVTTGSGGLTKYNRRRLNIDKTHWADAACVGEVDSLDIRITKPLIIECKGHGNRQAIDPDRYGFPKKKEPRQGYPGWSTGDIVNIVGGKRRGTRGIRVAGARKTGSFRFKPPDSKKDFSVDVKFLKRVHSQDGYDYRS